MKPLQGCIQYFSRGGGGGDFQSGITACQKCYRSVPKNMHFMPGREPQHISLLKLHLSIFLVAKQLAWFMERYIWVTIAEVVDSLLASCLHMYHRNLLPLWRWLWQYLLLERSCLLQPTTFKDTATLYWIRCPYLQRPCTLVPTPKVVDIVTSEVIHWTIELMSSLRSNYALYRGTIPLSVHCSLIFV